MWFPFTIKSKEELIELSDNIKATETVEVLVAILEQEFEYAARNSRYHNMYTQEELEYVHEVMQVYSLLLYKITVCKKGTVHPDYTLMGAGMVENMLLWLTNGKTMINSYEKLCEVTQYWGDLYKCERYSPASRLRVLANIIGSEAAPFPLDNIHVEPLPQISGAYSASGINLSILVSIKKEFNDDPSATLWRSLYELTINRVSDKSKSNIIDMYELQLLESQVLGDLKEDKPDYISKVLAVNDVE